MSRAPYPGIPSPSTDENTIVAVLRALKEGAEIGQRVRGDPLDSFVRLRELVALGLTSAASAGAGLPPDTAPAEFGDPLSVYGNPGLVAAERQDITAAANDRIFRRVGDALDFGQLTAGMAAGSATNGNLLAVAGGVPTWSAPAALTKVDDTNVTLTLGGTPTTALLQATSLTLGWTGALAKSRGGFGEDASSLTASIAELNYVDGVTSAIQTQLDGKQPLSAVLTSYAGGDTPSAFTLGIVDSADAAAWRTAIGAGTSSFDGSWSSLSGKPTIVVSFGALANAAGILTNDGAGNLSWGSVSATTWGTITGTLTAQTDLTTYLAANYQLLDSDLTSIAALSTTSYGRGFLELANAGAARAYFDLEPGTDVQAYSSVLAAYAGGDMPSAFTLGIVDSADAAAWRAAIGAGASTVTPAALTKADDTNVTLTLGGTPATALLQATSLTLGWTGTLSKARGGFGEDASSLTTSIAELNYVDGVTSAIQTQLDGKQPLDSDLTAIAALSTTSYGRGFLALADIAAARAYMDVEPGVDVQAYSAVLAAYAGGDTPSAFTLGIVDSANAAAWRSALGVTDAEISSYSNNANGYILFSNGFLLQWGTITATGNSGPSGQTVNYPTSFGALSRPVISGAADVDNDRSHNDVAVVTAGASSFTVQTAANDSHTAYWIAVGY